MLDHGHINSLMSAPAQKALSPAPIISKARTEHGPDLIDEL